MSLPPATRLMLDLEGSAIRFRGWGPSRAVFAAREVHLLRGMRNEALAGVITADFSRLVE
jgi:hypothetical protein